MFVVDEPAAGAIRRAYDRAACCRFAERQHVGKIGQARERFGVLAVVEAFDFSSACATCLRIAASPTMPLEARIGQRPLSHMTGRITHVIRRATFSMPNHSWRPASIPRAATFRSSPVSNSVNAVAGREDRPPSA
jgi:hypothetical protein